MKVTRPRELTDWIAVAGPALCSCTHLHYGRQHVRQRSLAPQWQFCEDDSCECPALKVVSLQVTQRHGTNTRQMTGQISVRMLPDQKRRCRLIADQRGITLAELARRVLLKEADDAEAEADISQAS